MSGLDWRQVNSLLNGEGQTTAHFVVFLLFSDHHKM